MHVPLFKQFNLQSSTDSSQNSPAKSFLHEHVNPYSEALHVPPLKHGLESHPLISLSQLLPTDNLNFDFYIHRKPQM